MRKKLPKKFYLQSTETVAQELLGCVLHRRFKDGSTFSAQIAETEAYLGSRDPAAHSFKGKTKRTESMFKTGGHFYVYLIYGMYYCLNVVTQPEGNGEAVLIRALLPLDGKKNSQLMGPGRLCRFLKIDKKFDGVDCDSEDLWIERPNKSKNPFKTGTRVGLNSKLGDCVGWHCRYYLPGMSTVKE